MRLMQYVRWSALKICLMYFVIGALWILFSDYLLYRAALNQHAMFIVAALKGWFYIAGTTVILYLLISYALAKADKSEQSRAETEIGYKELADSVTDIFFALDNDLRYTYWNKASEKFTSLEAKDILGKHVYEVFPNIIGTDGDRILKEVMEIHRPRSFSQEYQLHANRFFLGFNVYPSKHGLSVFIKDMTAQKRIEEELKQSLDKLQVTFNDTIRVLASVAEKRDPYIAGHQYRVSRLAAAIAKEMGLPVSQIEGIRVAGILHEIGKVSVPAEILNKPGPLSQHEFNIVKIFPMTSHDILKEIKFPWPVAMIALQHKEKLNGTGYPSGITGDDILLEARILGVADFIDAKSSHRPYRRSIGIGEVFDKLSLGKGTLYDPHVVDAALELFNNKGFSLSVDISGEPLQ